MKLTTEERQALASVREPCGVFSKPLAGVLKRLAEHDLCEVADPLEWQRGDPQTCPIMLAVITATGKRALRETFHRRPARSSRVQEIENAIS